jgi:hypothetical protein
LRLLGVLLTRLGGAPGQGHLYWGEVIERGDLARSSEMDAVRAFSLHTLPVPGRMAPVTRWVVRWLEYKLVAPDGPGATLGKRGTSWIWD